MKRVLLDFRFQLFLLFFVAVFLMFGRLGTVDLPPLGSAIHAAVSREILRTDDWLTLHWPGCEPFRDFYQFPPFFFWTTALGFKLFGISNFTARATSAFFGLGTILLTVWLGYLLFGRWVGYFSGLIVATTPLFIKHSRDCELESILVFFITLAIIFFILGERYNNKPNAGFKCSIYFILFGISTGIAFLSKGPPGYVTYGVVAIYIILTKQWKLLKNKWLWLGLILGIIVSLFWIVPQVMYKGDMFYQKFVLEQVFSSIGGRGVKIDDVRRILDFLYFFPAVILYYLPWGIVGFYVIYKNIKKGRTVLTKKTLILIMWIALIWIGFSIPGYKDNYYLLPLWPAWAIIIAYYLQNWGKENRNRIRVVLGNLILLIIMLVIVIFTPVKLDKIRNPEFKLLGKKIRAAVPEERYIYVYNLYYWDMAALFAWYIERGVTYPSIERQEELQNLVLDNYEVEFYFLKKKDYIALSPEFKKFTTVLCEEGRYILITSHYIWS